MNKVPLVEGGFKALRISQPRHERLNTNIRTAALSVRTRWRPGSGAVATSPVNFSQ
jgi:hypothetical protein